jgi:hypothetical protein
MVDHVALEIEQHINTGDSRNFYSVLKDYMVENKAAFLKDNRAYYKISDKKILKNLAKIAFSLKGLAVFFLILFCSNFINHYSISIQKRIPIKI